MRTSRTDLSRRRAPAGADPGRSRFLSRIAASVGVLILLGIHVYIVVTLLFFWRTKSSTA